MKEASFSPKGECVQRGQGGGGEHQPFPEVGRLLSPICWGTRVSTAPFCFQLQPQEISPPPTANLDRSNDKVYENVTGLVKAVIEMSSKIQPAPPEEYVPMVKVRRNLGDRGWISPLSDRIDGGEAFWEVKTRSGAVLFPYLLPFLLRRWAWR